MNDSRTNLTEGSIVKCIISFTIPLLLSTLLQQMYNAVDTIVVGQFAGPIELAAVGSSGAVINLMIGFFLGLATGTGILYAMYYGAGDRPSLKKLIDTALMISVAVAFCITVFGLVFIDGILNLINTPSDIFESSKGYLSVIFIGTVSNLVYNVGAGIIRAEGDSRRPLLYLVFGGIANVIADIVLVKYFSLGALGAAWATVASQTVTAILVLVRLSRFDSDYAFNVCSMRFDKVIAADLIKVSVPCGLQNAMFNISNFIVQVKTNSFGALAIAGVTVFSKLDMFTYMPISALVLAVSIFVGQNIGAGRYDRIKKGITTTLIISLLVSGIASIFVFVFFDKLVLLFTSDAGTIEYARRKMLVLLPTSWLYSFADIFGGVVRGSGQAGKVTVILAATICVFRIIWLELILPLAPTFEMVNLCYPISWFLANVTMVWFYFRRSTLKRNMRKMETA